MKKTINVLNNLELLHPKMQIHIKNGAASIFLWMFTFTLYVTWLDIAISNRNHPSHIVWVSLFGSTVVLTNVFFILTRHSYRDIVLMAKTIRKAKTVLNNNNN
jgi:hypothetical protein